MFSSKQISQGAASGTLVIVLVPLGDLGPGGILGYHIAFCEFLFRSIPETSKIYRQLPFLLVVHNHLMLRPRCWTQSHFGHRTWRSKAGIHQEASSLWASFHRKWRCSVHCWKRKVDNSLTKLWDLWVIKMMGKARYAHRYNSAMIIMGATNNFWLDLRPLQQEEMCVWYCEASQEPWLVSS